jgi:hypothetical protein
MRAETKILIDWLTVKRMLRPAIPATWEVEIRRIMVQEQSRQKVSENPISTNKSGKAVQTTCGYSYSGDRG